MLIIFCQRDFTDETVAMRVSHLTGTFAPANHKFHLSKNSVIRVITLIKIFAPFAPSREVISPRITGITRNFIRVIRVISVQKKKNKCIVFLRESRNELSKSNHFIFVV